mmetsp:Transcript_10137/g.23709  ORF Transcript_10137/g.23709 Transcript_10137/m.23709 type:complete len:606 (+) Transcript_10137:69-1886(+)
MLAVLLLCLLGSGVGSGSFQTASIDDIPTPLELTIQQLLPVLGSEAMDTIVGIAKGMPSPTNADPCQNLGRGSSALQSELSASTPLSNLLAGGAVAVHVGLPAEMLRLESTQDAMSTLSWHLFDSTSVRMAWGLQPMDTLERSKQRQSVMESQAVSEGAMLLAQLSFLKCVRSAAAPTIFSPLALRIGATADSEESSKPRGPRALFHAAMAGVVEVKSFVADGWCSSIVASIANLRMEKLKVVVPEGTLLEHPSWNDQRGLVVTDKTTISLGPKEERRVSIPCACTDTVGEMPEGGVLLTPWVLSGEEEERGRRLSDRAALHAYLRAHNASTRADAIHHASLHSLHTPPSSPSAPSPLALLLAQTWAPHINDASRSTGLTALHRAAIACDTAVARLLMAQAGADVEVPDRQGSAALLLAARQGCARTAEALLDHGARVDAVDRYGWTPLMWAARRAGERKGTAQQSQVGIVRLLLERGADARAQDKDGNTALGWAAWGGSAPAVLELLRQCATAPASEGRDGGDGTGCAWAVEGRNKVGRTPLMEAAVRGHATVVKTLLQFGADHAARSRRGLTAREEALAAGSMEAAWALEEHEQRGGTITVLS